jgi:phosphoribosylpyrophosphate synthetase
MPKGTSSRFATDLLDFWQEFLMINGNNFITIMPRSHIDSMNPYTTALLSEAVSGKNVIFAQVLRRNRTIKKQHEAGHGFKERVENTENSIDCLNSKDISGKTVWIFDDILTSGASMLEAEKVLLKSGAKEVYGIVLGLNKSEEEYEEIDPKNFKEIIKRL